MTVTLPGPRSPLPAWPARWRRAASTLSTGSPRRTGGSAASTPARAERHSTSPARPAARRGRHRARQLRTGRATAEARRRTLNTSAIAASAANSGGGCAANQACARSPTIGPQPAVSDDTETACRRARRPHRWCSQWACRCREAERRRAPAWPAHHISTAAQPPCGQRQEGQQRERVDDNGQEHRPREAGIVGDQLKQHQPGADGRFVSMKTPTGRAARRMAAPADPRRPDAQHNDGDEREPARRADARTRSRGKARLRGRIVAVAERRVCAAHRPGPVART